MFKFGLQRDFVDKNKNIKKYLAVSFGSLADKIADNLASNEHKDFHEFPWAYLDIFTKKFYTTADNIYKHLKRIITEPNLKVVYGDQKPCVVIMNKIDYHIKSQEMINNGIRNKIYKVVEAKALDDSNVFKSYIETSKSMSILKTTNLDNSMVQQKHINLKI